MIILFCLFKFEVMRCNELIRMIDSISFKTLSSTLKQMEMDELIIRTEFPQIPPKVEYRLSAKGLSLIPVLQSLCAWGSENSGGRVPQTPVRLEPTL